MVRIGCMRECAGKSPRPQSVTDSSCAAYISPKMLFARLTAFLLVAVAVSGCSGNHGNSQKKSERTTAERPSFAACVTAWNGQANRARRALVAHAFIPAGYRRAGIQMSLTSGIPGKPDPNPVGCRVVIFRHDRWIAYLARRDGDHFRFRASLPQGRQSDQGGVWPKATRRGPNNARIIAGAKLALRA